MAHDCDPWAAVKADKSFDTLQTLLERVLSVPVTSAPVECILSQSGLIMKPNQINQIKSNIFDKTKKQNKQTDENEKNNYKMYAKEQ